MGEKRTFRVEICFDLEVDTDWYVEGISDQSIIDTESANILTYPETIGEKITSVKMSRVS